MSEAQPGNSNPYDPFEPFRGMRDAYLDAMAKTMVEAVNTEAYAQASGAMLDTTLTISAPFREALEKSMLQVLQQLSLPSRQDILGLAERFTNMEMRLDDIDACLDGFAGTLQKSMLPILEPVLLLSEQFTKLNTRLDAVDAKLERMHQDSRQKLTHAAEPVAEAPAKRAQAAKQAPPTKRTASKGSK